MRFALCTFNYRSMGAGAAADGGTADIGLAASVSFT